MSLTLGLNTALTGLLGSQQGLNVLSQNISNVNTPGYSREVVNQQSITLAGHGAGMVMLAPTRQVDAGLVRQLNTQTNVLGQYNAEQAYYPQIESLFGRVGDESSIAATINDLASAVQSLSAQANQSAAQSTAVNSALNTTNQLNQMTDTLQDLRLRADSQLSQDIAQVNADLNNIWSLNQKIVRAKAIKSDTASLEDQRDVTIKDLAKYIGIQYYNNSDGSMGIYTNTGKVLLANAPNLLTHTAATITGSWMSAAGGQFGGIDLDNDASGDIAGDLSMAGGEIAALLNVRDNVLPDLQAQIDELSYQLKNSANLINNRGTSQPNITNTYSGTHIFGTQGGIAQTTGDALATINYYVSGNPAGIDASAGGTGGTGYGTLAFSYSSTDGQITINSSGANAQSLSVLTKGTTFTITGSATVNGVPNANDGTYTVTDYDAASNTLEVRKGNPVQTFSLANNDDVVVAIFDTNGDQLAQSTLRTIMGTDYSGGAGGDAQKLNMPSGPWSLDAFAKHMTEWMKAQSNPPSLDLSGASASLDSTGHMNITLGSTVQASLAFRDQTSSAGGGTAADATINFYADGGIPASGTPTVKAEAIKGFSNFLGLNDLFVTDQPEFVWDSDIQQSKFTTAVPRTFRISDSSGQVGNTVTVQAGSSLDQVAAAINAQTRTIDSALIAAGTGGTTVPSFALSTQASIVISDAHGTVASATLPVNLAGYSLDDIAKALNSAAVVCKVEQRGTQYRLSLYAPSGAALTATVTGGATGANTSLASQLALTATNRVRAVVTPEGPGQRLRLVQSDADQISIAGDTFGGTTILDDLGLRAASSNVASAITVRTDIRSNPGAISRGAIQWNADVQRYYVSAGDNTTAMQMSKMLANPIAIDSAGQINRGNYSLSAHAASTISLVATDAANSLQQQQYQQTLTDSLEKQYTSFSGVNIDEEVTNMISYQQAYTAAARVISTLQQMLETLNDMVR
jgi:flagellar hook-associated protein 1 FlgK